MVDVTEQKLDLGIENLEKQLSFQIEELYVNKDDLGAVICSAELIMRVADTLGLLLEFKNIPLADISEFQEIKE